MILLKYKELSVDTNYTALNDDQIKVYLTDYNGAQLLAPTLINDLNNYILYGKTNSHNSTTTQIQDKYKLRAWIDQGVLVNDWNENTNLQYKFKIGVTEKQEQVSTPNYVYSWSTSTVSQGTTLESISGYTTDYTTLGKNYFLKHNIGSDNKVESQEVCYIQNNKQYCLKGGDAGASYEVNKAALLEIFGENYCFVLSSNVNCSLAELTGWAYDYGIVHVGDDDWKCIVYYDSSAECSER